MERSQFQLGMVQLRVLLLFFVKKHLRLMVDVMLTQMVPDLEAVQEAVVLMEQAQMEKVVLD